MLVRVYFIFFILTKIQSVPQNNDSQKTFHFMAFPKCGLPYLRCVNNFGLTYFTFVQTSIYHNAETIEIRKRPTRFRT